jgi:asparagine synthetase B (glutamine-hydrolysing)
MCGIFAVLNNKKLDKNMLEKEFMMGENRGPEYSKFLNISNISLGFHRLAINGVKDTFSNQPFFIDGIYLICNGEIYNHKEITKILNITPKSKSDCEVIIHLYKKYGISQTVQMLDGVFAFVLVDTNSQEIFVSRDTYGVRPLFISIFKKEVSISNNEMKYYTSFAFASEMKSLINIGKDVYDEKITQYEPGCVSTFKYNNENYIEHIEDVTFSSPNSFSTINNNIKKEIQTKIKKGKEEMQGRVKKRVEDANKENTTTANTQPAVYRQYNVLVYEKRQF